MQKIVTLSCDNFLRIRMLYCKNPYERDFQAIISLEYIRKKCCYLQYLQNPMLHQVKRTPDSPIVTLY